MKEIKCYNCKNYIADDLYIGFGECNLMQDSNKFEFMPKELTAEKDKCYGWDSESYVAGVYVGENFGCIHWMIK
jgi:hypothetical protein